MANNIVIKDANNQTVVVKSTDNSGVQTPSHNIDTIANPLPVGTNVIGKVGVQVGGVDVATGNPVPVVQTGALPTGANLIGKVSVQVGGSDVANGNPVPVSIQSSAALPVGANVIGKVGVQVGGVDVANGNPVPVSIQSFVALPAGTATIGKIGIQVAGSDVSGANTVPVTQTGALPAGSNTIGNVGVVAALPAGENHVGKVGGQISAVGATFTRPANTTPYASSQIVANSVTASSVTPLTFAVSRVNDSSVRIRRARMKKSGTSITNASFRLHLYKLNPTLSLGVANGDGGTWLTTESDYLGAIDITMDKAFSDASKGIGTPNNGTEMDLIPSPGTQNIFGLLEARGAYTPVSAEVFTVTLEVDQD
jgi:hypothetical protein